MDLRASFPPRGRVLVAAGVTAWAVLLLLAVLTARSWSPDAPLRNDFLAFWTGASLVADGRGAELYDMASQEAIQREQWVRLAPLGKTPSDPLFVPYHNPPALALLMMPFTLLPLRIGSALWIALGLIAFVTVVAVPLRGTVRAKRHALLFLTFPAVADTLLWGQMVGLLALALCLGMWALARGRPALGGAFLGVLWLKPQYAVLIPLVLLVKGRWRELGGMAAMGAGLVVLSIAATGPSGLGEYLELLRRIGGYYPPVESLVRVESMVNWRALLAHLWPGLPESTGSLLVLSLGGATVLLSLLAWKGDWEPSSPRFPRQMLVLVLATLIAAPHSHLHGAALLIVPLGWMAVEKGWGLSPSRRWDWIPALGYLLALVAWPFRDLAWLMAPFCLVSLLLLTQAVRNDSPAASGSMPLMPAQPLAGGLPREADYGLCDGVDAQGTL